jgi:hypothetical protein
MVNNINHCYRRIGDILGLVTTIYVVTEEGPLPPPKNCMHFLIFVISSSIGELSTQLPIISSLVAKNNIGLNLSSHTYEQITFLIID